MLYHYDHGFNPPAPVLKIKIWSPERQTETPQEINALIDTGSPISGLPSFIIRQLGLKPVDYTFLEGFDPSLGKIFTLLYSAVIGPPLFKKQEFIKVFEYKRDYALLGRDVINHLRVTLNYPASHFKVEVP